MGRSCKTLKNRIVSTSLVPLAVIVTVFSMPLSASAAFDDSRYQQEINQLEAQIGQYQSQTARLQGQADTLENKIATITNQTQTLQSQIELNQAKHEQLKGLITENEQQLIGQKKILSNTLGQLYVNSSVRTIEVIASSNTVGDFMDKQQYRAGIRDKMKNSIDTVKEIKEELDTQQKDVERIVADQKSRRQLLASQKEQQALLLKETRGQEANYQSRIGQRNTQLTAVKEEQAAAFAEYERKMQLELQRAEEASAAQAAQEARQAQSSSNNSGRVSSVAAAAVAPRASGGSYPAIWANAPIDTLVDSWGMYNRECVSYAAWKVADSGRHMPYWGGRGNAYEWSGNARAQGIPISSTPSAGSVAVWGIEDIGGVGHVAYVEAVYGDGSILVSQYNFGVSGSYSEMRVPASMVGSLEYIRF